MEKFAAAATKNARSTEASILNTCIGRAQGKGKDKAGCEESSRPMGDVSFHWLRKRQAQGPHKDHISNWVSTGL